MTTPATAAGIPVAPPSGLARGGSAEGAGGNGGNARRRVRFGRFGTVTVSGSGTGLALSGAASAAGDAEDNAGTGSASVAGPGAEAASPGPGAGSVGNSAGGSAADSGWGSRLGGRRRPDLRHVRHFCRRFGDRFRHRRGGFRRRGRRSTGPGVSATGSASATLRSGASHRAKVANSAARSIGLAT